MGTKHRIFCVWGFVCLVALAGADFAKAGDDEGVPEGGPQATNVGDGGIRQIPGTRRLYLLSDGVYARTDDGVLRQLRILERPWRLTMAGAGFATDEVTGEVRGYYCKTPERVVQFSLRAKFLVNALAAEAAPARGECLKGLGVALAKIGPPAARDRLAIEIANAAPAELRDEVATALQAPDAAPKVEPFGDNEDLTKDKDGTIQGRNPKTGRMERVVIDADGNLKASNGGAVRPEVAFGLRAHICNDAVYTAARDERALFAVKSLSAMPLAAQEKCIRTVAKGLAQKSGGDPAKVAPLVAQLRHAAGPDLRARLSEALVDAGALKAAPVIDADDNFVVDGKIAFPKSGKQGEWYEVLPGKKLRRIDPADDLDVAREIRHELTAKLCTKGWDLDYVFKNLAAAGRAVGEQCVKDLVGRASKLAGKEKDTFIGTVDALFNTHPALSALRTPWDAGTDGAELVEAKVVDGGKKSFRSHRRTPSIGELEGAAYYLKSDVAYPLYIEMPSGRPWRGTAGGGRVHADDATAKDLAQHYILRGLGRRNRATLESITGLLTRLVTEGKDGDGSLQRGLAEALAALRSIELAEAREAGKIPVKDDEGPIVIEGVSYGRAGHGPLAKGTVAKRLEDVRKALPAKAALEFDRAFTRSMSARGHIADPCAAVCNLWKNFDKWSGGARDTWAREALTDFDFAISSMHLMAAVSSEHACPDEVKTVFPTILERWQKAGKTRLGKDAKAVPGDGRNPYKQYGWHFSLLALQRAKASARLRDQMPAIDEKAIEAIAAKSLADAGNIYWKGGSALNWFAMVLTMSSLSPETIKATKTTWTGKDGSRKEGDLLEFIKDKVAQHQSLYKDNPLIVPYDASLNHTRVVNNTERGSSARIAPTYALLWKHDPAQLENFIKSLESFRTHLGSLIAHSTRDRAHEGDDGLAPYYLMPSLPVTTAGIEAALPLASESQRRRLESVRDDVSRAVVAMLDENGNFRSPSGQFGQATMWTNALGILAILPQVTECRSVAVARSTGILTPGYRGPEVRPTGGDPKAIAMESKAHEGKK